MNNAMYLRNLRNKNRDFAISYLGGKCVKCGSVENLQFDHIDPKTKKFVISTMLAGKITFLIEELKKCQLLCRNCHILKSNEESRIRMLKTGKHGTMWMYWKYKCRCQICKEYKHQHYLKNRQVKMADVVKAPV